MKYILLFIFFFLQHAAYAQTTISTQELRIDPQNYTTAPAAQVLDEVNYIPLETTSESVFGAIRQLFVTAKFFIIMDVDTRNVFIFYKNGKFHCKIIRDNLSRWEINVDQEKREIFFRKENRMLYYNLDGKKLREEPYQYNGSTYLFSKNRVAHSRYYVMDTEPDTIGYELFLTENNKPYAEFLPYNSKNAAILSNDYFFEYHDLFYAIGSNTAVYYTRSYDYNIYQLAVNGLSIPYRFVFPLKNSLPATFVSDTSLRGKRKEYIENNKDLIYRLTFPYKIGDNLFFKLSTMEPLLDSYLYNLKTGSLISIRNIQPDALTFNLPITDLSYGLEFANHNFHTSDGKYVYTTISSAMMFKFKEDNAALNTKYNEVLTTYYTKRNRKDNPVIVQISPKNSF